MIQQLVYTVTSAADATDRVSLLIEGEPAGELWGAVVWEDRVAPADPLEVRQMAQIDHPRQGAVVTSPVTVAGEGAVFEASLLWRVLDSSGRPVAAGVDQTRKGQCFAPFRFEVRLEPGGYVLEVVEDDPSDGAGRRARCR